MRTTDSGGRFPRWPSLVWRHASTETRSTSDAMSRVSSLILAPVSLRLDLESSLSPQARVATVVSGSDQMSVM